MVYALLILVLVSLYMINRLQNQCNLIGSYVEKLLKEVNELKGDRDFAYKQINELKEKQR